jgi:hypothetical protein
VIGKDERTTPRARQNTNDEAIYCGGAGREGARKEEVYHMYAYKASQAFRRDSGLERTLSY